MCLTLSIPLSSHMRRKMQYRTFMVEATGLDKVVNDYLVKNPVWTLFNIVPVTTSGSSEVKLLCVLEGPTPRPTKPGTPTSSLKDGAQLTEHTNVRQVNFERKVA